MLGAIARDIIGSVYEGKKAWLEARTPDLEPLFAHKSRFTDDTVRRSRAEAIRENHWHRTGDRCEDVIGGRLRSGAWLVW